MRDSEESARFAEVEESEALTKYLVVAIPPSDILSHRILITVWSGPENIRITS
jgi:hypothetical protein